VTDQPPYKARVPREMFDKCLETRENQIWADDRGVVFGIAWDDVMGQPLAAVISVPEGMNPAHAWYRDTPQPDPIVEN
jgi:hypothetical protein